MIWFHCPTQCSLEVSEEEKDADAARALLEKKVGSNPRVMFYGKDYHICMERSAVLTYSFPASFIACYY